MEGLVKGFPVKLLLIGLLISELLGLGFEGIEDGLLEGMEMEALLSLLERLGEVNRRKRFQRFLKDYEQ